MSNKSSAAEATPEEWAAMSDEEKRAAVLADWYGLMADVEDLNGKLAKIRRLKGREKA